MRRTTLSILFFTFASRALAAQTLGLVAMDMDVEVDTAAESVAGTARLTVKNFGSGPATEVPLLLNRLMRFRGAVEQAVVTFPDEPKLQVNAARLALADPVPPGSSRVVSVSWSGILVGYVETGRLYVKDHVSPEFTLLREDAWAFPVVGAPSRAASRAQVRPAFTFDVRVTVPRGLVVAAGGEPKGESSGNGTTTYRFASAVPVPFLNVAIAPYDVTERDGVRLYSFRQDADGARRLLERVASAVKLLSTWLGPPPAPPRFTVFEIPDGWGSQAHLVAGVMQTSAAFRDAGKLGELYHELSHLWNPRDTDVPSPRWNEGLAMFLQWRLADALDGGTVGADAKKRLVTRLLESAGDSRLDAVPLSRFGEEAMTDHSYSVAALWFLVLSRACGEERYLAALRGVLQAHMSSGISTKELTSGLEDRLGATARAVDADFVTSTAWLAKLRSAGDADALADSYRASAESRRP